MIYELVERVNFFLKKCRTGEAYVTNVKGYGRAK